MRITHVTAEVRAVAEVAEFYHSVLGLPTDWIGENAVAVRVGATTIQFVGNARSVTDHHFAITVPSNKFAEAKRWLAERSTLLSTVEGDEFECSPPWNARSIYFDGPDRSVLELIVRRDLPNETSGGFTSADLLAVSEVGVATPDVAHEVALLAAAGILPYGVESATSLAPVGDIFAPVGDIEGMLILVKSGRTWFPTSDRVARVSPLTVVADGALAATVSLARESGSLRLTVPAAVSR